MTDTWQFNTAPWVMVVAAAFLLASAWFFILSMRREGNSRWMTALHALRFGLFLWNLFGHNPFFLQ